MQDVELDLIRSMLRRAETLHKELGRTYGRDLHNKTISHDALNLTHEIIEKCSNALDQAMALLWQRNIKPHLSKVPTRGGYFPAAKDENGYRSTMGQWGVANLAALNPTIDAKLRQLQPFARSENSIYARIKEIAATKHTGLQPQRRYEQQSRVNVISGAGQVSWGPGVTFGHGVSVLGVPIDPRTQMPAHTQGIDVTIEHWVSFHFEKGGEDALGFCQAAIVAARRAIGVMFD
ncbi:MULTISPECIES: hypothetical protein [unclassified Sphingomonas]|uniref:hypothetical protein n=1 Tax=unclassified Sphingomonas TaxID=196159 RepID=UPI0021511B1A|nr:MULTISPECIES: hypothetical protein [unclassified Sphingomonas]MCR5870317.1 hypothetical protein [Sphingomonas sp. J344]UUX97997.1 hypothetical protein LRS08_10120 [Sphingomonas sp. J315]